jgi:hypothetical protein
MTDNTANASIYISLESIQQQVEHCENIVNNIDKLVPNLYKIRQQALAQKNYILDIQHTLMNNNKQLKTFSDQKKVTAKVEANTASSDDNGNAIPGFSGNADVYPNATEYPTVLVISAPSTNVTDQTSGNDANIKYKNKDGVDITKNIIDGIPMLRKVIQSLYKFKHDQGTAVHFTTEQIDASTNGDVRRNGLNLSDVESITEGLNDYLSISNKTFATVGSEEETKIKNTVLKLFAPTYDTVGTEVTGKDNIDTDTSDPASDITIFKAPINKSSTTPYKEITAVRTVKSRRIRFSTDGPVNAEYLKIVTFGLN